MARKGKRTGAVSFVGVSLYSRPILILILLPRCNVGDRVKRVRCLFKNTIALKQRCKFASTGKHLSDILPTTCPHPPHGCPYPNSFSTASCPSSTLVLLSLISRNVFNRNGRPKIFKPTWSLSFPPFPVYLQPLRHVRLNARRVTL